MTWSKPAGPRPHHADLDDCRRCLRVCIVRRVCRVREGIPRYIAFVQAFAGGAVIAMLTDSMIPEAYEKGGNLVGLVTAVGFAMAFGLTLARMDHMNPIVSIAAQPMAAVLVNDPGPVACPNQPILVLRMRFDRAQREASRALRHRQRRVLRTKTRRDYQSPDDAPGSRFSP